MTDKRKTESVYPPQGSAKQQKIFTWTDDEVGCTDTVSKATGVLEHHTYEGLSKDKRSLKNIKRHIKNIECCRFGDKDYFYYTGFKKGLTTLLSQIHEENIDYKALLIHGIPQIGKTSLAHNLAYHLAYGSSAATVVTMDNSQILDPDHVTRGIRKYIVGQSGWIILDQVNVNSLNQLEFIQILLGRPKTVPVIIFTSGHYPPGPFWSNDRAFCLKVIDLQVDEAGVRQVKRYLGNDAQVQVTDMLKVTTVMGHVYDCILGTRNENAPVGLERLQESVYEIRDLSEHLEHTPVIFWMLWPEFCQASPEEVAKANKPEDWTLTPYKVQLLGELLGFEIDPQELKSRLFGNWLHIAGDGSVPGDQKDGFFEHKNYWYYFPFLEKLHRHIKKAYIASPVEIYQKLLEFYTLIGNRNDLCTRSVQGSIFETLVSLRCQLESLPMGLVHVSGQSVSLNEVNEILTPHTVAELCKTVEQKREANSVKQAYWCDLNRNSKSQFPGYDFAFIQMEKTKYLLFQLFQATVNPGKQNTNTMVGTFKQIKTICKSNNFAQGQQVLPYFLCPRFEGIGDSVNLGAGSKVEAQVVKMIKLDI